MNITYPTSTWLDQPEPVNATSSTTVSWWPHWVPDTTSARPLTYWYETKQAPRPIRLKLSEVERLRVAAKGDDDLRAVLQKFAPHIEIEVDFD